MAPTHSLSKAREDSACQYRVHMWVSVFFNIFLIGGRLFYSVVLVSAVQQSQP